MRCRHLRVPVQMEHGLARPGREGREGTEHGLGTAGSVREGQRALEGSSSPALASSTISWRSSRSQRRAVLTTDSNGEGQRADPRVLQSVLPL